MEIVACRANTEVALGPSTRKTGINMKFTLVWYPKGGPEAIVTWLPLGDRTPINNLEAN